MAEYQWTPPEHPDVTLFEPYQLTLEQIEGPATHLHSTVQACTFGAHPTWLNQGNQARWPPGSLREAIFVSAVGVTVPPISPTRRDRPVPDEPYSLSLEARGVSAAAYNPPLPVHAWVQTPNRLVRVEAVALEASRDAVLVEWGRGNSRQTVWVWRAGVRHRREQAPDRTR